MTKFVTVAFRVSEDEAKEMSHESAYLDVFGFVRWSSNGVALENASRWSVIPESSDAGTS